jgi:hypothetical protein
MTPDRRPIGATETCANGVTATLAAAPEAAAMGAEASDWSDSDGASLDQEPAPPAYDEDGVVYVPPRKLRDEAAKLWRREHPVIELANESLFTTLQVGALRRLKQQYWRLGSLPNDERKLQRLAGLSDDEWTANRDDIAEQFDPGWRDSDLEASRQAAIAAYSAQVEHARERQARHRAKLRLAAT